MSSKDTEELNDIAKVTHRLDLVDILKNLSSVASAVEAKDPTYISDLGTLGNLVVSREKQTLSGHNSFYRRVKPRRVQMNHIVKKPV